MIPNAKIYTPERATGIVTPQSKAEDRIDVVQTDDSYDREFVIPFPVHAISKTGSLPSKKKQIAFQSKKMNQLVQLATQYARSSASVMVTGESGTGKELFSRLLHEKSTRADKNFVAFNCAAIPESLMESEIFGHEKGAFTGAIDKRVGYFEKADQGTLLLDEISEIPLALQAKLLRVLEEQEIQSIGSDRPRRIDVRIVATSNRDLKKEVALGNFRADLYHRLNVLDLRIPPMRERVTDIPLLVLHFVAMFRSESVLEIKTVTKDAMHLLCAYHWPGNVRELRNVIHRACVVSVTGEIGPEALPCFAANEILTEGTGLSSPTEDELFDSLAGLSLAEVERHLILICLRKFNGNKKSAAEQLGVTARTLSNKLKQYREQGLPL